MTEFLKKLVLVVSSISQIPQQEGPFIQMRHSDSGGEGEFRKKNEEK